MIENNASIIFEKSARQDGRWWITLIVGAVFTWAGLTVDPLTNCDSNGDCAPWLVPIAAVLGIGTLAMALGLLIGNGRRGSKVDFDRHTLAWWQGRRQGIDGESGEIPLAIIASIKVIRDSDSDSIHFYDSDGGRLPLPDTEIVPWPFDSWAERVVARVPHIQLTITDR